jgi:ABC-2 type transport system ATP-binding protein
VAPIEARELRKSYGAFEAVRGVSFTVEAGESVALLGPNGAGKTTTIEILEGYRSATSGQARVLGTAPDTGGRSLRRRVGIVLQEAGFPLELTVLELVEAWRRYYPDPLPAAEVIEAVGLASRSGVRTKNLSGGEHRRLDLALGIVGRPEVLFLDEPTTGFDPAARRVAWELIAGLVGKGLTLLLTTHYLEEARVLTDRIIIMAGGRIVAEGSPESIGAQGQAPAVVSFGLPPGLSAADLPPLPGGAAVQVDHGVVRITAVDPLAASHAVTGWALERRLELPGFRVERPSLEDTYLTIVAAAETAGSAGS